MIASVLQTKNLTKRFGALTAVDNLSLEVYEGEIFGFLGPNGAGKTTSINMMCGLLKPDAGQVLLHGKPVYGGDPEARARVGVCPQETILWDKLTCLEQLEFIGEAYGVPRKVARQRGADWLEKLGLAFVVTAITSLSIIGIGLIVACFSKTVSQAFVIANFPLGFLMFLTGAAFPLPRMNLFTVAGRSVALADFLPPFHAVVALNKIFTLGAGFGDVFYELTALVILTGLYFGVGVWLFQRTQMR
jgi:hypothetical protein